MANDPIDEAYVEIKPDLKDFDRDVQRGLDRSFDRIEDKLDDVVDVIERQFGELIKTLHIHFEALEDKADRAFEQVEDSARSAAKSVATDIKVGTTIAKHEIDDLADNAHHDFNRIERDARGSGFSIGKLFSSIGKGVANLFGNLVESVSSIGSKVGSSLGNTIGQIGSSIGTVTGSIGSIAQLAAMGVIIPVAIGLASALSQLIGVLAALPAAAGVAFAAVIPLIFAFKGFGEAISAVIEGDPKKINEALKQLSPSAAKVVKEFQNLLKPLGEIKKIAQEAFFAPLVGTLTQLASSVLPALRAGVAPVAAAFGNMFASIAKVFANGETGGVLNKTFETTARIINGLTPVFTRLVDVVSTLFVTGLPYVERFFTVIGNGVDVFSEWLAKAVDGGKVTGWLETAWDVGKKLYEVIKQLSIFAGTLLGAFSDEGTDTLNGMGDALKRVNEYLASDKGQETLHNLGVLIHWAGNAFVFLINSTTKAYSALNSLFNFIRGIGPFFEKVGQWFSNTWTSIVEWTKSAWHTVQDAVISGWNGIISYFSSVWTYFKSLFVNGWNNTVSTVSNFITRVKNAVMAFPGILMEFLSNAVDWVTYHIGYAIGLMIKFFLDLPSNILGALTMLKDGIIATFNNIVNFFTSTIPALVANVGNWFKDMWSRAWNATVTIVTNIIDWFSQLPGKIWNYVNQLQNSVVNTFNNLKNKAVDAVRDLVNKSRDEASKLPGRIIDAIQSVVGQAYDIGKDMVRGMVNGIKDAAGWLWNQARDVVLGALKGAKDAIGVKSPSKEWAKMGKMSVIGYAEGLDSYDLNKHVASSIKMPLDAFRRGMNNAPTVQNSVQVGGAQLVAYLQIGDDQLQPVVVRTLQDNPQEVALASQQGDTQLSRRR